MIPVLLALFLLEMRLPLTSTEHILAQLGILFLIYGFVQVWLRANRRALMGLDEQQGEWQVRVYTDSPAQCPDAGSKRRRASVVQISSSRIEGRIGQYIRNGST